MCIRDRALTPDEQISGIDYMAQRMFVNHGITVDLFYGQDLELYMNMQCAEETEKIYYIDDL